VLQRERAICWVRRLRAQLKINWLELRDIDSWAVDSCCFEDNCSADNLPEGRWFEDKLWEVGYCKIPVEGKDLLGSANIVWAVRNIVSSSCEGR
jgi:hypothetical protein